MAGKNQPLHKICKVCGNLFRRSEGGSAEHCKNCKMPPVTFETTENPAVLKKFLIKERGYMCESCGLTHWLGEVIPLQLDHINGDSDNNSRINLRIMCPTCHSMTPTFGARNAGRFPNSKRLKKLREYRNKKNS